MPLKFAANLNFMFQEIPTLCGRFQAAKQAGFKFVESGFPYGVDERELNAVVKETGLEQVMMNAYQGNRDHGDLGIAAIPGREDEFKEKLELSIQYSKSVNCKRMHVMAGKKSEFSESEMEKTYLKNLKYAADRFQKEDITVLIEPINSITVPKYFLNDYNKAVEYIQKINLPNLKLELDLFHLQIIDGNLTNNIKRLLSVTGHLQISQVPYRGEPDTDGEINYPYVLQLLEELGYDGYIGLEYKPKEETVKGLKWLNTFNYKL